MLAEAVELDRMSIETEARTHGVRADPLIEQWVVELRDRPASRTDKVVVMLLCAGELVARRPVLQWHPAHDIKVLEEPDGSEDGGAPDARNDVTDVFDRKEAGGAGDGFEHRAARPRKAVPLPGQTGFALANGAHTRMV